MSLTKKIQFFYFSKLLDSHTTHICFISNNLKLIAAIRKTSKFEDEIREEQESRKREEDEKKQRQQSFKERAAMFGGQGV